MILIYNRSGLLVVLAGALVALPIVALSRRVSLAAFVMAAMWIGLSFWWRRRVEGVRPSFPALFFIPLPILALPLLLFGVLLLQAESRGGSRSNDPRAAKLDDDVATLKASRFGGNVALSQAIHDALLASAREDAGVDTFHFFSRVRGDAVLVLVGAPSLKRWKEAPRVELLRVIDAILAKNPGTSGKRSFVGLRGNYAFGALKTPPDEVKTGSLVDSSPLLAFYDLPEVGVASPKPDRAALPKPAPPAKAKAPRGDRDPIVDDLDSPARTPAKEARP